MKNRFIILLLLFSFFLNISHASIIANQEHCAYESSSEYLLEMDQSTECGNLCEVHHLFHIVAILTPVSEMIHNLTCSDQPDSKLLTYTPPFKKAENKPPIA
ncbi:hypothetical protein SUN_0779 [Sulfurovum sp. NBC37-1]|nr:hypothetical protein SUN_0779 [Sulfurovum sp. NBC37-1]